MNKIINVDGIDYKIPAYIIERNEKAEDHYGQLFLDEVVTGQEEFDRVGDNDFLEAEVFSVYAEHFGIEEDDVQIEDVRNSMFAYYKDYDDEDYELVLLEKA